MSLLRFKHKAKAALRCVFPTPAELIYVRQIKKSRMFDRHFYLTTNSNIHWLYRAFPERHYVQRGETLGLRPNPDFSPFSYLFNNPDLDGKIRQPFHHYINWGRHESRVTKDLPIQRDWVDVPSSQIRPIDLPSKPKSFAVVVHLYYHDLWPDFAAVLKGQLFDFDLFVTVVEFKDQTEDVVARIHRDFPEARVLKVTNHGRDILPFLQLINSGALTPYRAICKLHTKKSPHRQDGDIWRRHLIEGILGHPEETVRRLDNFLADEAAGFWVADGQHFKRSEWWGSNQKRVQQLLRRIEISADPTQLSFPAGSMYWVKPIILDMLRGLQLGQRDFEQELSQVDGTTAHALERAAGYISKAAGLEVRQATELDRKPSQRTKIRPEYVSAFYLPQFHPVPQNDLWWGKGFTEWRNVVQACPAFEGHAQPILPGDLGFYDLRLPEVMAEQARMARKAGIDAFCVYHYWFDGERVLGAPVDNLLQHSEIDFPFYLCWANESWRRNWDGLSGEVLMPQSYAPGFATQLAQSLAPIFEDKRYQRPDGVRPRFLIYRPEDMPDPAGSVAEMRQTWKALGIGEVELGAIRFHIKGEHPVPVDLFDFWVEMPPHGIVGSENHLFGGVDGNRLGFNPVRGFQGLIYDYTALETNSVSREHLRRLPRKTIAGIMPSWDNTARRGLSAHMAYGANPGTFRHWLLRICAERISGSYRRELFINAWNEWAEKAILEPSSQYGDAYLRVLAEVLQPKEAARTNSDQRDVA